MFSDELLLKISQEKILVFRYSTIVMVAGVLAIMYFSGLFDKMVHRKENKGF